MRTGKQSLMFLASIVTVALSSGDGHAALVDIVINGEFEIRSSPVPGWSASSGALEFFNEGAHSSPATGSDGLGTGSHHEITRGNGIQTTTSAGLDVGALVAGSTATFSFDTWRRAGSGVQAVVTGSISGTILDTGVLPTGEGWILHEFSGLSVVSGEAVTLAFTAGPSSAGDHIDQVSFTVNQLVVPEPSSVVMGILGLGVVGLLGWRRRRRCGV